MSNWHRKPICKTCFYLRRISGKFETWDGKACHYTIDTGEFRDTPATDTFCKYYRERRKSSNAYKPVSRMWEAR